MIDPGMVGSPMDVATFAASLTILYQLRESQGDGHAVTVALAEVVPGIADDRARADLDVDPRDSAQYLLPDGGHRE